MGCSRAEEIRKSRSGKRVRCSVGTGRISARVGIGGDRAACLCTEGLAPEAEIRTVTTLRTKPEEIALRNASTDVHDGLRLRAHLGIGGIEVHPDFADRLAADVLALAGRDEPGVVPEVHPATPFNRLVAERLKAKAAVEDTASAAAEERLRGLTVRVMTTLAPDLERFVDKVSVLEEELTREAQAGPYTDRRTLLWVAAVKSDAIRLRRDDRKAA
jgi:hypothetical protein